jgi:CHAD domain-containing protein
MRGVNLLLFASQFPNNTGKGPVLPEVSGALISAVAQMRSTNPDQVGLPYWMDRVLQEHSKVGDELAAEPVHDLRVALRRCILIAEVMRELDPGSQWKAMRKAGRRIFNRLGALRDTQIQLEWIEKLGSLGKAPMDPLVNSLNRRSEQDRIDAQDAVRNFDRKQWRIWIRELASHYRHVAADRPACESLLIQMWDKLLDLHRRARKNRSRLAYHRLRIGLKKFRYAVENFLPSMYPGWEPDFKFLQDLLGEIHDLSVLQLTITKAKNNLDDGVRVAWIQQIEAERESRLRQYREKTAAKTFPLASWREGLPPERELRSAGLAQLAEWAYFLSPDLPRGRRIAKLSLQLYDGFANCGLIGRDADVEERYLLHAAALLQEVGHFKKGKAHHKESYRMIRRISPPAGWTKKDLEIVALIARFHRRALPRPDHRFLKAYTFPLRQSIILLASILRFANAFHAKPYRPVRSLIVEDCAGVIVVRAEGFPDRDPVDRKLSAARRLVEFVCQRPVHILAPGTRSMSPRILRPAARSDAA